MENRIQEITAANNPRIKFAVIPGHFATNHSHVSCYIDLNGIKNSWKAAKETAKELAGPLYGVVPVDAIICIEGTRMVGAFLAEELSAGMHGINSGNEIYVITPEFDMNNRIILRDNIQKMVRDKNVLLLVSSVSSGKSIQQAAECLAYYGGRLVAASAIFSAVPDVRGLKINSVFTAVDMPEYTSHSPAECPMCASGAKIDALVNTFGYSKLG
ncbi:MAG: orotate phosphoribosyltransferase [Oscillospiraceae bacterium]|nr:orotate phosphoribosyltransferase [Oscillospiraceae bacterium]